MSRRTRSDLPAFVFAALGALQAAYGYRPKPEYEPRPGWEIDTERAAAPWYPTAMVECFEGAGNAWVLGTSPEDWAEACAASAARSWEGR